MYFFIEMGQGLVRGPDFWVSTSVLYSCTLIAGYNQKTGKAGAFHYPSEMLLKDTIPSVTSQDEKKDVCASMDRWVSLLQPSRIILVMAAEVARGIGVSDEDAAALKIWANHWVGEALEIRRATAAGMARLGRDYFDADTIGNLKLAAGAELAFDDSEMIKLDQLPEAKDGAQYENHGGFVLFGKNREKT